jgi:iron-sulfur cluster assembly protein
MAVTLTPAAVTRIRSYLAETPGGIGLRFGVRKSGCSGFAYVVDIATTAVADEEVFETDGVAVRVDADSLPQVDGTVIDFVSQGLNQQFVFRNPRVAGECGCGESFTTDAERAA